MQRDPYVTARQNTIIRKLIKPSSFSRLERNGPVFEHPKLTVPSQMVTKPVPIAAIFRFRDTPVNQSIKYVTNTDFWSPLHNSPFGANNRDFSKISCFLREALFPSGSEEKLMFFSFVTRIIDFCERYREGVTRLLDLVGLSLGF